MVSSLQDDINMSKCNLLQISSARGFVWTAQAPGRLHPGPATVTAAGRRRSCQRPGLELCGVREPQADHLELSGSGPTVRRRHSRARYSTLSSDELEPG